MERFNYHHLNGFTGYKDYQKIQIKSLSLFDIFGCIFPKLHNDLNL